MDKHSEAFLAGVRNKAMESKTSKKEKAMYWAGEFFRGTKLFGDGFEWRLVRAKSSGRRHIVFPGSERSLCGLKEAPTNMSGGHNDSRFPPVSRIRGTGYNLCRNCCQEFVRKVFWVWPGAEDDFFEMFDLDQGFLVESVDIILLRQFPPWLYKDVSGSETELSVSYKEYFNSKNVSDTPRVG